jgi:hypothetical protein
MGGRYIGSIRIGERVDFNYTGMSTSLSPSRAAGRQQVLLGPICAARADARGNPSRTDLHVPVHGQSTSVTAPRGAAGVRMPPRAALRLYAGIVDHRRLTGAYTYLYAHEQTRTHVYDMCICMYMVYAYAVYVFY